MRPKFIMLVGIPGSGKSTHAKCLARNANAIHLSSDSIRAELYGDEATQGNPSEVFEIMHKRTLEALANGNNVIYDATNITRRDRASILSKIPKYVQTECHIVWAPIETCIERDSKRERSVGKEVIDRMLKRFQAPYYDEGFDSIEIFRPDYFDAEIYTENIVTSNKIPHDNPHHAYPVDEHCRAAGDYLYSRINSVGGNSKEWQLVKAAYSHDIGKGYTKSFKDTKGNVTEIAHYYQHQCVGAWMSYGLQYMTTPYIAWLISTHMEPFFKSRYYLNLPPFMKKDIDLLHEADLNAH